jgi:hypothetical protein
VPASEPDPLDLIAQASDLASLDEELNQLPQKYRDVLVMSYFAQQTNQEIADQLNESKGAVDGRIRDARRMLRVRLARRGVEVGVLAMATAYVQSSASAATPALIQKAISLGAPGMISQELAALNAADVAHMKLLTSTGIPLMSKIGLTIGAGLVVATGLWGMTQLAAFQGADGEGDVTTVNAVGEDTAASDETAVELRGRTEASDQAVKDVSIRTVEYYGDMSADGNGGMMSGDGSGMREAAPAAKPRSPLSKATAEFSRRSANEVEQRLNELVHLQKVKSLSFPGENPLTDILEQISVHVSQSQDQRFTILPDVPRLDEDSISLNDVIIKDIELDGISLSSALDIIMGQTDPALTWIARNEVILITTESAAESDEYMFLRSYDITRLREITQLIVTASDAGGGQGGGQGGGGMSGGGGSFSVVVEPTQFGGGGGMGSGGMGPAHKKKTLPSKPQPDVAESANAKQESVITWEAGLLQTIQEMTGPPCRWHDMDGEGGRLTIAGNRLIVRQSRNGHEQVVAVLEQLEMAADDAAEEQE